MNSEEAERARGSTSRVIIRFMIIRVFCIAIAGIFLVFGFMGCAQGEAQKGASTASATATPSKSFTKADVAKLKWIEGTWRGVDGDKPFFERYRIEETAMVVEGFKDETLQEVTDTDRFELKDGEFGKGEGDKRSAASEITADYVQFVPAVAGKSNSFRFRRQPDGTWHALLEWPASGDKPSRQKMYKMEPWPGKAN